MSVQIDFYPMGHEGYMLEAATLEDGVFEARAHLRAGDTPWAGLIISTENPETGELKYWESLRITLDSAEPAPDEDF